MDCIVHGVAKSWTRMSDFHFQMRRFRLQHTGESRMEVQKRAKGPVGPGEKTGMRMWSLRG